MDVGIPIVYDTWVFVLRDYFRRRGLQKSVNLESVFGKIRANVRIIIDIIKNVSDLKKFFNRSYGYIDIQFVVLQRSHRKSTFTVHCEPRIDGYIQRPTTNRWLCPQSTPRVKTRWVTVGTSKTICRVIQFFYISTHLVKQFLLGFVEITLNHCC